MGEPISDQPPVIDRKPGEQLGKTASAFFNELREINQRATGSRDAEWQEIQEAMKNEVGLSPKLEYLLAVNCENNALRAGDDEKAKLWNEHQKRVKEDAIQAGTW